MSLRCSSQPGAPAAVQAGTESVKSAGEEALNEADQAGSARHNRGK